MPEDDSAEPSSPEEPAPPAEPTWATYHDLLHGGEARVELTGTHQIHLGERSGAGTTLASWGTGVREALFDGNSVGVVSSTVARLVLPIDQTPTEDTPLVVRLRGFVPTPVTAYLNGEVLGHFDATTDFTEHRFQVAPSELETGQHILMFRARRRGRLPTLGQGSLAIDWVRIGDGVNPSPEPPADAGEAPSDLSENARSTVTRHFRWVAPTLIPAGARLAIEGQGTARISVRTDALAPIDGGEQTFSENAFTLPLETLTDRIVEVEIEATSDVQLSRVAVEVPPSPARNVGSVRNVLLVLIDTLRADKLRPYAPESRVQTPQLMRFVERATIFERAHSQENWTKPSVATLLTSLMPWEHGATQYESVLRRDIDLLPEVLQEHGFVTASFICNGFVSDRFGFGQGWNSYRNYIREGRRTRSQFVAADVLEWLDGRPQDQPFFLYVHTIDPHVPYRPPREILSMYGDPDYRGPVNFSRDATLLENVKLGRVRLRQRDRDHLQALYDGEISYHDRHFGSILEGLEARGLSDDTMVVITSDHGEEFWDHGSVGHGHSVYEELLHVPLFVRLPGNAPRRIDSAAGLVDIMPTILEALGLPVPEDLSGRSLLPDLRAEGNGYPRGNISGFMDNWRTYAIGRWKLIERPRGRSAVYDLEEDPRESTPLTDYPITRRVLRQWMGARMVETPARRVRRRQSSEPAIDAETEAQLRALGYVR